MSSFLFSREQPCTTYNIINTLKSSSGIECEYCELEDRIQAPCHKRNTITF